MLLLVIHLHTAVLLGAERAGDRLARLRSERGQTSAEYALVLLGAASIALLVGLWAKKSDKVGGLLDAVFDNVVKLVK